ncbi:MAG TPA: hypothetical protein VIV12_11260 [Streptosporangiaceae bacterium]
MTGALQITQADRARWQRQAASELTRILDAHPQLPAIAWTVGPAGCVLAGRVSGLAPAGQVRDVFDAWRAALALGQDQEQPSSAATVFLAAAARRGGVTVQITATVFDGHDDDVAVIW